MNHHANPTAKEPINHNLGDVSFRRNVCLFYVHKAGQISKTAPLVPEELLRNNCPEDIATSNRSRGPDLPAICRSGSTCDVHDAMEGFVLNSPPAISPSQADNSSMCTCSKLTNNFRSMTDRSRSRDHAQAHRSIQMLLLERRFAVGRVFSLCPLACTQTSSRGVLCMLNATGAHRGDHSLYILTQIVHQTFNMY